MSYEYANCYYCGGKVMEKEIEFDYRRKRKHYIIRNVPVGVCKQCGEKFFRPNIAKKMDDLYHKREVKEYVSVPVLKFSPIR